MMNTEGSEENRISDRGKMAEPITGDKELIPHRTAMKTQINVHKALAHYHKAGYYYCTNDSGSHLPFNIPQKEANLIWLLVFSTIMGQALF